LSSESKLHDLAGLFGIAVDGVILRDQQVAVGCFGHRQRTVQVSRVLVDDGACPLIVGGPFRTGTAKIGLSSVDETMTASKAGS
jgi:hypothetical protein